MKTVYILILFFLSIIEINAQFFYPMVGKTNDDFSSAYGSRDKGSGDTYDYDWHAAIDIAGSDNEVVPVLDGEVIHVKRNSIYPYKQSVFVHHADDIGDFIVEYQHIIPAVSEGEQVTGGISLLGITADFPPTYDPSGDHLDIRYFNNKSNYNDIDVIRYTDTSHPWEILQTGGDFSSEIKIMKDQNNELYSGDEISLKDASDGLGNYFEFALRVDDDELDIAFVQIDVWGWDNSGNFYTVPDLIQYPNSDNPNAFYNIVDFNNLYNCGDWTAANSDEGHNSASVGIYPRKFNSWDPYHTVYFRWYVNEDNWSQVDGNIYLDIWARDQYDPAPLQLWNIEISNVVVGIGDGDNISITNYSPLIDKNETATFTANYSQPEGSWGCASNWNWSIILQHEGGTYELQSQYFSGSAYFYNCSWTPVIEQLPTGFNWTLGPDGYIKGYVKVTAQVTNGYYTDIKPIEYNYLSAVKNLQIAWFNNHPKLTWDSNIEPDIASYKIWKNAGGSSMIAATVTHNPNSDTQSWIDYDVTPSGRFDPLIEFRYKVKAIDNTNKESVYSNEVSIFGNGGLWKDNDNNNDNITTYKLQSNYPNPFNPSTKIEFQIPKSSIVNLTVYNSLGEEVAILVNQRLSKGRYTFEFNARDLPSGVYFYVLRAGNFGSTKKMILLK